MKTNDNLNVYYKNRNGRMLEVLCHLLDRLEVSAVAKLSWYSFVLGAFLIFSYGVVRAQDQTAGISVTTDLQNVGQNDSVELIVHLDSATSAYYFEAEVSFDPDRLILTDVRAGNLLGGSNGIAIGELLEAGTAGISGSRTSGEGSGPGQLIHVTFQVKAAADTGFTEFQLAAPLLKDSLGTEILTNTPAPLPINVKPEITAAGLSRGSYTIHEAQKVAMESFTYAHQVTDVLTKSDSLRVWMGISMSSDPTAWTEQQWKRAQNTRVDAAGNAHYEAIFGPALTVGSWYYAMRFQLNDNPYQYGGFAADTGSFWHVDAAPAGQLKVDTRPPYQHTLARWDFDDQNHIVDQALTVNRHSEIEFAGAKFEDYDERDGGYTLATDSWHMEEGADSVKYIKTHLSTTDFENIRVSSSLRATSSSARDFQLQVSVDDSVWTDVPGGAIEVTTEWGMGTLSDLQLPAGMNNQPAVYLRWQRIGDIRADGTTDISTQGKVRVDDIIITGTAINPQKPIVWPGDADNNGLVDVSDVLPLGTWWGMNGPDRILRNISWNGIESIGWFPLEATFADTDGSGIVDHSDLEAVGMNFGNSSSQIQSDTNSSHSLLARLTLPALKKGEEKILAVIPDRAQKLTGIALEIDWTSNQDKAAEYFTLEPVFDANDWLYTWQQHDQLLHYERQTRNDWKGAWVHKGWTNPHRAKRLMRFRIIATRDWKYPVTYRLKQASLARPDLPALSVHNVNLELGTRVDIPEERDAATLPETTLLHPNYPNPFNPATNLRYELAEAGKVSFHIYSLLGKKVATLVENRYQQAGSYSYNWDASGFSSGVYLYVLKSNQKRYTGKMLLMK